MRRFFKWLGVGLFAVVVAVGALAVNVIWFKPFDIRIFYEKVFLEFALESPQMLTSIRMLEPMGIRSHNARLDDISPAHTLEQNEKLIEALEMLHRYDRDKLSGQTGLSYDVLDWFLSQQVDGLDYTWHGYPVNQTGGVQNFLPSFMASTHHIGDLVDAEHYLSRLSAFDTAFEQLLEDLSIREQQAIIPPRFAVFNVLEEMNEFVAVPAKENVLYSSFEERLDTLQDAPAETRADLLSQAQSLIDEVVYPAYGKLIVYFEALRAKATTDHGVWKLPNGAAFYAHQLRVHTTTDMGAEEIHQIGLSEVARIQSEMDAILRQEGYTEGTIAERMSALNEEPRFLFPDTDQGREDILQTYRDIIEEVDARMDEVFLTRPKSPVVVERVPEFRQAGAPGAYYHGPSFDGSRPGTFFANLRDVKESPRYGMRTLAYHEAIPGHHWQTAAQIELKGVPQFRRILPFTAFSEGWALYTEQLAWEMGLQQDPYDNLGRLQAELFRAVRLVVDTGIHSKRWTREAAIAYMRDNTGIAEGDVVSEIERYMVWPGQATAYKVGMLKILELREFAQTELGDAFDIREFHDVVLRNGDIPLTLLEREVVEYVAGP